MEPVKVYVATCLERREDAHKMAEALRSFGATVVSTWHDDPDNTRAKEATDGLDAKRATADACYAGIDAADAVVVFYDYRCRSTLAEFGYARGIGKYVAVFSEGNQRDLPSLLTRCDWFGNITGHEFLFAVLNGAMQRRAAKAEAVAAAEPAPSAEPVAEPVIESPAEPPPLSLIGVLRQAKGLTATPDEVPWGYAILRGIKAEFDRVAGLDDASIPRPPGGDDPRYMTLEKVVPPPAAPPPVAVTPDDQRRRLAGALAVLAGQTLTERAASDTDADDAVYAAYRASRAVGSLSTNKALSAGFRLARHLVAAIDRRRDHALAAPLAAFLRRAADVVETGRGT